MEENVQENPVREERAAGENPADEVGVRVDPAELATRPLSQFILSKEYAGVSSNPELIRPVTLVAAARPVGERRAAPVSSTTRRIEYPFYDDDESDAPPAAEEPIVPESAAAVIETAPDEEPVVLDLAPERPVTAAVRTDRRAGRAGGFGPAGRPAAAFGQLQRGVARRGGVSPAGGARPPRRVSSPQFLFQRGLFVSAAFRLIPPCNSPRA